MVLPLMLEMMQLMLNGVEVKKSSNDVPKQVQVNLDIDKLTVKTPDTLLVEFTYKIEYNPGVGILRFTGEALCRDSPENVKKILAEYKKRKIIPYELGANAVNMINANVGMNAIFVLRPFGLIPHFMPPPILVPEMQEKKKSS
jgi:hypothetical protein